jgi:MFS transporter, CP family, cyanate transporter
VRRHLLLAAIAVALVACNLRLGVASVGPVLDDVQSGLDLSGFETALLTAVPVLCFGFLSPFAPVFARRIGIEPVLAVALAGIAAGLALRVAFGVPALFLGTILAGGSIAVGNVLLPALVKRDFPWNPGLATGLYLTLVAGAASIAAGLTVPIGEALGHGWRGALGVWALPAAIGLVAMLPLARRHTRPDLPSPTAGAVRALVGSRLAWMVTVYMGLQSLAFYVLLAWLPSIYRDEGYTRGHAGALLALIPLIGLVPGIVAPALAARRPDQRLWTTSMTLLTAVAYAGLIVEPAKLAYLWVVLLGVSTGANFSLTLTLVILRTRTTEDTARLSALSQGGGYLIAALGPLAVGLLHEVTGSWTPGLALVIGLLGVQLVAGLTAGRRGYVT